MNTIKTGNIVGLVIGVVALLSVIVIGIVSASMDRIEPGYVGIKVNMYGDQKGVDDFPLQTGRVWLNPFTEEIYKYPTFMQHAAWTGNTNEGAEFDQSISFNSAEGSTLTVDVGVNFTLDASKVPLMFVEFRQPIQVVIDTYFRNQVRDAFNRVGGKYKAVELFGTQKQALLDDVTETLDLKLQPMGFEIDTVSFISAPVADPQVMRSINMVIEATQKAIEAENKVKQIEAEARQEVAKAEGKAQAILAEAEAQAEANKILNESLTPSLIQYKMAESWNGTMPQVVGSEGVMPMLSLQGK